MGIMREVDAPAGIAAGLLLQLASRPPEARDVEQEHIINHNDTNGDEYEETTMVGQRRRRPRYAVLLCADDSDHVTRRHGGYLGVFRALLAEKGERWDGFRVSRGQFPSGWGDADDADGNEGGPDEPDSAALDSCRRRRQRQQAASLDLYDGFVVTGSCSDAHSNEQWIRNLVALLRAACAKGKRVLGICFGHQVLCRALGGKTGRAAGGWDIGVTTVNFNLFPPGTKHPHGHHPSTSLAVIECHRDEVLELPPGAEALAWSEKTGVEAFRYNDVAMGIQGHPEYTQDILLDLIERLLQRNLIQVSHANAARDSLGAVEAHREAWKTLCTNFLKGNSTSVPVISTATFGGCREPYELPTLAPFSKDTTTATANGVL